MKFLVALSSLGLILGASARTFTVYNGCPFTIWPAIYTGVGAGPSYPTGWAAGAFTSVTFDAPDNWTAGRIWARRNCDANYNCLDGGCVGGLQCTNPGVPPATLAEFTLTGSGGQDYFDVSLVDGYNLPMSITNNVGCSVPGCYVDLGPNCPAPLKGPFDSTGFPVGCKSACLVDPNPSNSPNCCTGQYSTPATCPSSGVEYYSYFKGNCPNTYSYAYDESSGDAIFSCPSASNPTYTITFCPPA
ncbi:hypothetical protein M378DRAFT_23310 [Amanita muscaria Koide BX008]|uniref:Thaumatin-like protein n=1 Tax=Amanita muscaria (strain Koide BX008) TaxID=946122 RepID=A0A0C2XBD5_AMAMK|nr:hypothetical protein M378DRAFT_23310 [Amanita muscaria Koide BX008]